LRNSVPSWVSCETVNCIYSLRFDLTHRTQQNILTLLNHSKGVINALIAKINNAMAERLNGKIQEIKLS